MDGEQLLQLYEEGQRDFSGLDLRGIELYDETLLDAVFDNSNLSEADLCDSRFVGASFVGANLTDASFEGATVMDSTFAKADIQEARFYSAWLSQVDFSEAHMEQAKFDWAVLRAVNFRAAHLDKASFAQANLKDILGIPEADYTGLLSCLIEHSASEEYVQKHWCTCLASAAAAYVGCPENSGMGLLVIGQTFKGFKLNVLHGCSKEAAIAELNKFTTSLL